MNAIPPRPPETADQRTARQLRMAAELADLAMQLARDAAAKALAAKPEETAPSTETPEAATEPASAATPRRTAGTSPRAPSCKTIDPALLFIRMAAVVRYCIALEIRLTAAGTPGTPGTPGTRAAAAPSSADPRRTPLRETFRHLTVRNPGQAALLRDINTRLDEHLAADPGQTLTPSNLFAAICEDLNFEPDFATLPDEYLDLLTDDAPAPCATPPP